ncbi:tRNA (adenosine(37)-N6)-threonylcarbamoyltransferase complex ATPase subunit type 1 TsaE [Bdellovibrio bacteriovorus]|uniref:tRNA threonylcarbamoyladenosine biosynthesis protein TsaE n=1 Tax=Bdellovibrio bacteriovorus TaxID=959 RepID=A0A150WEJ0_BDEBC|nr:tRNA (adenosine(37)-N6)-threonylcarbamoyltransferase complex ATPase subunit type 1 TsaE [Bdellovibrio bacteriovorus]KYG61292.1 tRNA threonylcarbamoyladenosine biosynthesis protein TsaE [Bdellovibrio bacteriovorus]
MSEVLNSERTVRNLAELKEFWKEVLPALKDRCILLMSGDVGAGKTTSVQLIAEILGMRDVQSPSFAIHLRYENQQGQALDHLDLYRLKDDDDLESSGFWDLFSQQKSLIIIEWANRLDYEYLPMNWQKIEVQFQKLSDTERKLKIQTL